MFGVVLRVIGSKVEAKWFSAVFGQNPWTNPLDFGQNFKFVQNLFFTVNLPFQFKRQGKQL